ncbi:MAG: ATP-binding cassette domain-containing protein [Bdellovibrionales bacterium]|nr:ATP-binding cassette domain-containing protein [Bdellovibrionales bacterium]
MIIFRDVHKAFGPKKVLNGLNLEIQRGEIFFMLGRSGTGKSVALKHLVGLLRADRGEIELDGQRIERLTEKEFAPVRRKCGLVFQLPALLDSRTILENITFGIRDVPLNTQIQKAEKALREVNLDKLVPVMNQKYPPQISYGEQKRVALARTLLVDPDYILYDEPTTGLDPVTSRSVHELIRNVSRHLGKTALVVSHDMRNALETADRIAVLDAGKVVDLGTPKDILASKVELTCEFLRDVKEAGGLRL